MVNLGRPNASIANIQDLANPQLQSIIEIAPYYNQTFQFGNYLVAQVQSQQTTTTAPTRICRSSGFSPPAAISMVPLRWPASQWGRCSSDEARETNCSCSATSVR